MTTKDELKLQIHELSVLVSVINAEYLALLPDGVDGETIICDKYIDAMRNSLRDPAQCKHGIPPDEFCPECVFSGCPRVGTIKSHHPSLTDGGSEYHHFLLEGAILYVHVTRAPGGAILDNEVRFEKTGPGQPEPTCEECACMKRLPLAMVVETALDKE